MSVLIENQSEPATNGVESTFADVLAEVMRVDRVSVDSHFFNDLGADSLVMAHFCARVRKRGNLPQVSMKDVYAYPTVRSLATALAHVAPGPSRSPVSAAIEAPTRTSSSEYVLCGALQFLFFLAYSYVAAITAAAGYEWISAGANVVEIYVRSVVFGGAGLLVVS